ncbi:MAG: hypothetical protein A3C69_01120 [Candidatus Yanofskybacteria bacterium RIFCSPHIGHO2_02_FULL_43_12]|nr:MAG: hypothetical protein A3C69_01120 [Candidatus Yanofskybacteria bacterium RIFCSPHIGHO2_02_FULL_43_12]
MSKIYDIAIVGGGINGAATACYAAARGLSVILLEKNLCGRQTTAGSSRLIHGGLRYLSYNIDTALASCRDSGLIIRMVPHLLKRQVFIMPIFEEERWITEFAETYLELYDRFQPLKGGMPHVRLSRHDVRALIPGISMNVVEGLTFDEWLIDPVALVSEHVKAAKSRGAEVLENAEVKTIRHCQSGQFALEVFLDGRKRTIETKTMVNAAGPWADRVAGLLGLKLALRPTRGVHLLFEGQLAPYGLTSKIGPNAHILISQLGKTTLVGPTDDAVLNPDPDILVVRPEERKSLLDAVEKVLPGITGQRRLIGATVALRALPDEPVVPKKISRDFQIISHENEGLPGAISVFSGKMSEYHLMASRIVNQLGGFLQMDSWQNELHAYRMPDLKKISLQPKEYKRIKVLVENFQPSAWRLKRQMKAWTYLAGAFFWHWPKKVFANRRGLAIFKKTYAVSPELAPASMVDTADLCEKLRTILGADKVSDENDLRQSLTKDKWPRLFLENSESLAIIVVQPETAEDVSKILVFANANKIPVIPYGAGSGVCGAVVPNQPAITMDMRRFDRICICEAALCIISGTGVNGKLLEKSLNCATPAFTLGHFPASLSISSVGGWLGTRSSGQESTKYGDIDDLVIEIEAVFPNGDIRRMPGKEAKKYIGSEGTLCVFTEAVFRICPLPEKRYFCAYSFNSFADGIKALEKIAEEGLEPNVLRLYDALDAILAFPKEKSRGTSRKMVAALRYAPLINRLAHKMEKLKTMKPLLILVTDSSNSTATEEFNSVHSVLLRCGAKSLGEKPARIWYEKRFALNDEKLKEIFNAGAFVNTLDFWATWKKMPETYDTIRKAVSPYALCFAHISHLSRSGACLYITYVGRADGKEKNIALYDAARDSALAACVAAGSQIEHHHAIGLEKLRFWKISNPERHEELRTLKKIHDPNNIMNPGKLIVD